MLEGRTLRDLQTGATRYIADDVLLTDIQDRFTEDARVRALLVSVGAEHLLAQGNAPYQSGEQVNATHWSDEIVQPDAWADPEPQPGNGFLRQSDCRALSLDLYGMTSIYLRGRSEYFATVRDIMEELPEIGWDGMPSFPPPRKFAVLQLKGAALITMRHRLDVIGGMMHANNCVYGSW